MKRNDRVFVKCQKRNGVIVADPRASGKSVRIRLDGNKALQYFDKTDVELISNGTENSDNGVHPSSPDAADPELAEMTLDRLVAIQRDLRRRLEALDESIAEIRIVSTLKKAISALEHCSGTNLMASSSAEAVKIKQDTEKAMRAARRLAAQGML